jgi:hypothetical protein
MKNDAVSPSRISAFAPQHRSNQECGTCIVSFRLNRYCVETNLFVDVPLAGAGGAKFAITHAQPLAHSTKRRLNSNGRIPHLL